MSLYLDDAQRQQVQRMRTSWRNRSEWPTWLLIATIYGSWFGTALNARSIGLPLATTLLAILSCWHMSLQHELLHGHPTRFPLVNALFGFAPLAFWFPYSVYRESHLRHHDDENLTDPDLDPESYFVSARRWSDAGTCLRYLYRLRNTVIGRMLLGPAFSICGSWRFAAVQLARGNHRAGVAANWTAHVLALGVLAAWLNHRCGIPPAVFAFGIGYPALSLGAIRSFHEHRAAREVRERTVINEAAWPWRLLFLNNNYHLVHHDLPHVPWFALRTVYETSRQQYIERSGGFLVQGYGAWLRLYAFAPVARPVHGNPSDFIQRNRPVSARLAGRLRLKLMEIFRQGKLHDAHPPVTAERQPARQAL
jgi:fatty acid desaturase